MGWRFPWMLPYASGFKCVVPTPRPMRARAGPKSDPERRFVGNCRHFTVLLCAFLRARGVPARARCGFGA